jgi:hypothetical protein
MKTLACFLRRLRLALSSLTQERTNLPAIYIPLTPVERSDPNGKG